MARHAELEAAILADRDDPEPYRVYGDWLEEQDDPRGRLIALQLRIERSEGDDTEAVRDAKQHVAENSQLIPPASPWKAKLKWTRGFLSTVEFENPTPEELSALLRHPSAAVLSRLVLDFTTEQVTDVCAEIVRAPSPIIDLEIRHPSVEATDPIPDAFWDGVPYLHKLKLANQGLFETLRHERLERLDILGPRPFRLGERWHAPALAWLQWTDPVDRTSLLLRSHLPGLRELMLHRDVRRLFHAEFLTFIARLRVLRLPQKAIAQDGEQALALLRTHADAVAHLDKLIVAGKQRTDVAAMVAVLPNLKWMR